MLLRTLLQVEYGVARRQIISLIDQGGVFINQKIVENYKAELSLRQLNIYFMVYFYISANRSFRARATGSLCTQISSAKSAK